MSRLHEGLENKSFPAPNGLVTVDAFCLDSGLLATEYCTLDPRGSRVSSETVHQDDLPTDVCTVHTADGVVKLCKDSPIKDASEAETGMYHQAGDNCPEESIWEVCLPNYSRELLEAVYANDEMYTLRDVTSFGICDVHLEPLVPEFDPTNPFPWFPDFDFGDLFFPDSEEPEQNEEPQEETPSQDYDIW
jgi:penicillin-binding protein 1A